MREQPWHTRQLFSHHLSWFRDILTVHGLTRSWIQDITLDRQDYELDRGIGEDVRETLWMLDKFSSIAPTSAQGKSAGAQRLLESLLDDTSPDDLLARMESGVWAVQAATLQNILGQNQAEQAKEILNHLEQVSWKNGRDCAREKNSKEGFGDLRTVFEVLKSLPFLKAEGGITGEWHSLLKIQARENLLTFDSRVCPHQSPRMDVKLAADPLCHLQSHWVRGYIYDLNPKIHITFDRTEGLCRFSLRT